MPPSSPAVPARFAAPFYVLVEVAVAAALSAATWFSLTSDAESTELSEALPDFTPAILVFVGLVWAVYVAGALRARRPPPGLDLAVDDAAERHLVEVDGERFLPAGAPATIVREIASAERWALPGWLSTGQGVLISLGLAGTFLGLTLGLWSSLDDLAPPLEKEVAAEQRLEVPAAPPDDPSERIQKGMRDLLGGAKLAFVKSLAGVLCGLAWTLRYRRLEVVHSERFDHQRERLEQAWPTLGDQALLVRMLQRQSDAVTDQLRLLHAQSADAAASRDRLLGEGLRALEARADETNRRLHAATNTATTLVESLHAEIDRATTAVTAAVDQVAQHVEDLSNSLPQNIGDQTAGLLKGPLEQLTVALAELKSAGGQAIGDTLATSVGAEVTGLRQSLTEVTRLLADLGPRVDAQVQQGAATAAAALSDAGRATSDDLRAAAADMTHGVAEIRGMAGAVRDALAETQQIALALRGAGDEVSTGLRGVAEPLDRLPTALDGARAAMIQAQEGFARGTQAAVSHAEQLDRLLTASREATTLHQRASADTRSLADRVAEVREACAATVDALNASSAGQQTASAAAARDLVQTVASFQQTMQETQRAVQAASQSTFEGAQAVTLEAARKVAQTLSDGATTFDQTLQRLSAYGAEIERSLAASRDTTEALEAHAQGLQQGVVRVAQPLAEVAAALRTVGPEVREAAAAVNAERQALGQLGEELRGQAGAVRIGSESLAQRIVEYKDLQRLLSTEWATHVRGIEQLLDRLKASWAEAVKAADSGVQQNAEQLATYAKRVEDALKLPSDLRNLGQTLETLSEVLEELGRARVPA